MDWSRPSQMIEAYKSNSLVRLLVRSEQRYYQRILFPELLADCGKISYHVTYEGARKGSRP
jgi:hypothetical protein